MDVIASAGLLYRGDLLGFGASWRSSSKYELDNRTLDEDGAIIDDRIFSGRLTVPSRAAIGLAVFPSDSWVISSEISRVSYSDVLSEMHAFDIRTEDAGIDFRIEDATEYHLGAEYTTFSEKRGWSIRMGWWRNESHLPYVEEDFSDPRNDPDDLLRAQLSLIREKSIERIDHYTLGFGFSTGVIRIDGAVDYSSNAGVDALISGVFYF